MANEETKTERPRLEISYLSTCPLPKILEFIDENQKNFKRPRIEFSEEFHVDLSIPENSDDGKSIPRVKGAFLEGKLHGVKHLEEKNQLRLTLSGRNLLQGNRQHFFSRDIDYKVEQSKNVSSNSVGDGNLT